MALAKQHRLRAGRFSEVGRPYLITVSCHQRQRVFDSFQAGRCFAQAIADLNHDADPWCWVAMPDHVHWRGGDGGGGGVGRSLLASERCSPGARSLANRVLPAPNSPASRLLQKQRKPGPSQFSRRSLLASERSSPGARSPANTHLPSTEFACKQSPTRILMQFPPTIHFPLTGLT